MFPEFPKKRSELPEAYQSIYLEHYKKNRAGATPASFFSNRMERWLHRKVAADSKKGVKRSTLEIGAGTLNHLPYEENEPYDIVEPLKEFYTGLPELHKIREVFCDIDEIPASKKYERIISIANFEHILNLPEVVAKSCLLLDPTGTLRVAMPNEGTPMWWLAYNLTTGIEFRLKYGLNYTVLMKHEHVNTADEIEKVLAYFFEKMTCSCYGISKQLAFYRFYECSVPLKEKAKRYLEELP